MSRLEIDTEKPNMVSRKIIAQFTGLSETTIREYGEAGLLDYEQVGKRRKFDLIPTLQTYCEYQRNRGKQAEANMSDEKRKLKADADWKTARAEIELMKRDELKGSLHSSDDVLKITRDMVMAVRASILAIPGRCAVDCANAQTASEVSGIIKTAINGVLNELTQYEYDPDKYRELVREREAWLRKDDDEK